MCIIDLFNIVSLSLKDTFFPFFPTHLVFPEFTITPKDATVVEERSVVFDCSATGIPTPIISWSFKGSGSLPSTSSQLSNGSLLVTDVQNNINYEGTYTCSASSKVGVSTVEANLTVWGRHSNFFTLIFLYAKSSNTLDIKNIK